MATLLSLKGLGGFNEIGASATLITLIDNLGKERNLLVDSGIRMKSFLKNSEVIRTSEGHSFPGRRIDAVLITHGHADHVANLPIIMRDNPNAQVFMTRPTYHIAGVLFENALHLMEKAEIKVPIEYHLGYSKGAVSVLVKNKKNIIHEPGWVDIFPGVRAYFGPNGHIRGSAFIVLDISGKRIMFTGDISVFDTPTVFGMKTPEEFIGNLDAIFTEATNGDRIMIERTEEEARLVESAKNTLAGGGSCLFPAFGVGRSPDVLLALVKSGIKTYIDGLGRKILGIYGDPEGRGRWCDADHSFGIDIYEAIESGEIGWIGSRDERSDLIYSSWHKPFCVVTTAGMMADGSCAMQYALKNGFLKNPKNLLGLTGFQAELSEGREIEEGIEQGRVVNIASRQIEIKAQVPKRFQLSSHADGMQIAEIVGRLNPKKVFIVHGNDSGRKGMEKNLRLLGYGGEIFRPSNGDITSL